MESKNLFAKILVSTAALLMGTACAKISFNPVSESASTETPQPPPHRVVSKTEVVAYGNKKVDFLLVLDDSNSMLKELKKLSAKLASFVNSLEGGDIDWQMCFTTTRGYMVNGALTYGPALPWYGYVPSPGIPSHIIKRGTNNLNSIFTGTVNNMTIGGPYSGDERGIKAAHDNFANASANNCYREGAAISVILISDEDERSVGGDISKVKPTDAANTYIPLEAEDYPETLLSRAKLSFGDDVRFTFNSIIVKPGDLACEAEQDLDTSPSHPGVIYEQMSQLTGGGVGSICDSDYGPSLNSFRDKIINSLSKLTLDCEPLPNTLKVKIAGFEISGIQLEGKVLKFPYPLSEGTEIDLNYLCSRPKTP